MLQQAREMTVFGAHGTALALLLACLVSAGSFAPVWASSQAQPSIPTPTQTNDAGAAVIIDPKAFAVVSKIGSVLAQSFIQGKEPISLPEATYMGPLDFNLTLAKAELSGIQWTNLAFSPVASAGGGVLMAATGLKAQIKYEIDYSADLIKHHVINSVGSFSDTTADLFFLVGYKPSGRLSLSLLPDAGGTKLDIKNLDLGILPKDLESLIRGIVEDILDDIIPREIASIANPIIAEQLETLPLELLLGANKTSVSLAVVGVSVDADNGLRLSFSGAASPTAQPELPCPFRRNALPTQAQSRDVELIVADSTLQCALWALQVSGGLEALVGAKIAQYLKFDDRLFFGIAFPFGGVSELSINSNSTLIAAELTAELFWDRLFGKKERYITLDARAAVDVKIAVSQLSDLSIVLNANISRLELAQVNVSQQAADIPAAYRQQIRSTNFAQLEDEANDLLRKSVIPAVNADLVNIPVLPGAYTAAELYLRETVLEYIDGVMILGADLVL